MSSIEELLISLTCNSLSIVGKSAFSHIAKMAVTHVKDQIQNKSKQKTKLDDLKQKFEMKLSVITPTIDLFEIMVSRGNTALSSAMQLTLPLKEKINLLSEKISYSSCYSERDVSEEYIINSLQEIITIIDNITPMLNLALLTSQTIFQQSSQNSIQTIISPSKVMRATIEIYNSEMEFLKNKKTNQVGPSFHLKLYSLFTSSSRKGKLDVDWTWKEEFYLSRTFIKRVKNSERDYNYELEIVENLEDGRYHEPEEIELGKKQLERYYSLERKFIPGKKIKYDVCNIKSLYYTNASSLLNIQGCSSAVLVLKIEISNANKKQAAQEQWIAFELNNDTTDDDSDSESESESEYNESKKRIEKRITKRNNTNENNTEKAVDNNQWGVLSHLEYLLRLTMLENYLQTSCTLVNDEILTLFLQSSFSQSKNQKLIKGNGNNNKMTNIQLLKDSSDDIENGTKTQD